MRIPLLIVDDNLCRRKDICVVAREAGFEDQDITYAKSESEAYDRIANQAFLVAVVDIQLPNGKEGLIVIRHLQQMQPECRIIALTGAHPDEVGADALQAGAHDFIYTHWPRIDYLDLLLQRFRMWRRVVYSIAAGV